MNERPVPVIIEWLDINSSDGGWQTEDEIKNFRPALCYDVCFIYSQNEHYVNTYSSYNLHDDGSMDYGFITSIPSGCIRKITKL